MKLADFGNAQEMAKASETFLALLGGKRVETITDPDEWMKCGHHIEHKRKRPDGKGQCVLCNLANQRALRRAQSDLRNRARGAV